MQGNTEFEEGEACCYKYYEDNNIDLDSLSYIDEKIQRVLGHFQKDFEGAISAEHLGPKFGDYGSFLPTCERSPPFQSRPKSPQRHFSSLKSPRNLHMEVAFHNSKAPSNMPPYTRLGTASYDVPPFHGLKEHSVKKNPGISSNAEMEKCTLKDNCANKSQRSTYQRTLKLRIKVKSDILSKKRAAIYSGLGLDDSPSPSKGNSPGEREEMAHASQGIAEESLNSIVQVMTSFTIPGGVLISPVDDSLLCLIRKEKVFGDRRHMSSLNGHQEHCSVSTNESDSFVGDVHLLENRKVRMVGQSEKQYMNGNFSDNDMALHTEKRLGNRTPDCKDFLTNNLKCTPLSSSICDVGETAEVTGKAFEVSKEVNKDGVECRMYSTEAVKEDSMESISGQDFDKIEKQKTGTSFLQKDLDHKPKIRQNNNSIDPNNNGKYYAFMISKKAEHDAVKYNADQGNQKHETNQKGKAKFKVKNKSNGEWNHGKVMTAAVKDSVGAINNATVTDKKSAGIDVTSKNRLRKIKSANHTKVGDSLKGKKSEQKVDGIGQANGPRVNKATINANLDIEEKSAYGVEVKERPSNNKKVNQLLAGTCVKDAPGVLPIAENKPIPEMVPPPTQAEPQLIEEDWVCCDSCQKWRLLPMGLKPEQLPEKWLCSMLYWLPGMNRCNISEEDTTKALYALYQMPISEGKNNVQSHTTGPETGMSSADALQFGLNHKRSSFDAMSGREKKKHGIKEKKKTGISGDKHQLSNTAKNNSQESDKDRSLIDMNQQPADSYRMNKSGSKHLSRLTNLTEEKNIPEKKEKQMNGAVKLKRRVDSNQYRSGTPKKSQTEGVCYADKPLNPDMEFEKMGQNSRNGLPTNSSKNGSIKKRKSSDWLDHEQHKNTLSVQGDMGFEEESNVSGMRKDKKLRVLNTEEKSVTEDDDILSRKGAMQRVFMPDSRNQVAFVTKVKSVEKAERPRKLRKNDVSYQALDCFDSLGKDLGSRQHSLAAASSSSKVSGSHKAKTNLEDARGSPVESVTSSPLRTSNIDKRILAAVDISEKYTSRKGGLYSMSSRKSLDNKEGKPSVKMKEKILYNQHPEKFDDCGNDSHHEEKMNKDNLENALSWQKSGKVTSLRIKEKDGRSGSDVSRDKTMVSASENGFSKNGANYEIPVNPNYHISGIETRNDAKNSYLEFRHMNVDNFSKKNSARHSSTEAGKQTEVGHPVHVRNSADASCTAGVNHSSANFVHDGQLSKSSPVATNSSQAAFNILEEATRLKDSADHYKNSGFEFESNETYFKAALMYLHGASLLENCHGESTEYGEMSQMQIYATTAKLFESCAHKYNGRQEMAAAALAYKCTEVACMRLVYCKHSSINKDRLELQSTLQMVSQGESPSSSASDLDNLNNMAAMDKANLPRSTNTHVANNQVISARNRPNIARLLDFTQDINFAMEASRKCHSTFMAANLIMEEAQNRDCINSIRKVIDFSFQDVDELVRLVFIATKAITRAGLGGARD